MMTVDGRIFAANQDAFIQIAERVAIFGGSQAELERLEELRKSITVLERDLDLRVTKY